MLVWSAMAGNGKVMFVGVGASRLAYVVDGLTRYLVDMHGEVVRNYVA